MKHLVWVAAALTIIVAGPVTAGDIQFKPIDTNTLVVKPSKAAADLSSKAIQLVGNTTAGAVESDGFVKTINNLFGFKRSVSMPVQAGRSPLPAPQVFSSTQYKSYNTPVMPTSQPVRRR
jgi:hypothetical protein